MVIFNLIGEIYRIFCDFVWRDVSEHIIYIFEEKFQSIWVFEKWPLRKHVTFFLNIYFYDKYLIL